MMNMMPTMLVEDASTNGGDAGHLVYRLIHGWTAGPLLIEFVTRVRPHLLAGPTTLESLAQKLPAEPGPLGICLRTAVILGYANYNPDTHLFEMLDSPDLVNLVSILSSGGTITDPAAEANALAISSGLPMVQVFREIYTNAVPPFKVPSETAAQLLSIWNHHRSIWKDTMSDTLCTMLDGMIIAPLLCSLSFCTRWNDDGIDTLEDNPFQAAARIDCKDMSADNKDTFKDILGGYLKFGSLDDYGAVTFKPMGLQMLREVYSYFVPMSYIPLLGQFHNILYTNPALFFNTSWGLPTSGPVHGQLNAVGCKAHRVELEADMMSHVHQVFSGEDFDQQPQFVVIVGCGDGQLMFQVFNHVQRRTRRGDHLKRYPLAMVGVALDEQSLMLCGRKFNGMSIPHKILLSASDNFAEIKKQLTDAQVDLSYTLYIRPPLENARTYTPPASPIAPRSAKEVFAHAQLADTMHLDKQGKRIRPSDILASLIEHFEGWEEVLKSSAGLIVQEDMSLDIPSTRDSLDDGTAFDIDIVRSLARSYQVPAPVFAVAAASSGLVPSSIRNVQTWPEGTKYCQAVSQHLVSRPFQIRFAEIEDLPRLEKLEELTWNRNLRAGPGVLQRRLKTSPTTNLVCTIEGIVVAVLYMQRIDDDEVCNQEKYQEVSQWHNPKGKLIQLIAISADPAYTGLGIGSDLRAFALHLAHLDPTIEGVVAVTLARNYKSSQGSLEDYVHAHDVGELTDPIIGFHTSFGAKIQRLVPGYRPEDHENGGVGVLIRYNIDQMQTVGPQVKSTVSAQQPGSSQESTKRVLFRIMDEFGYAVDEDNLARGFFDYGMDSVEVGQVRMRLTSVLNMDFPTTLLFDYPSVESLSEHLDKMRETRNQQSEEVVSKDMSFETMTADDVIQIQEEYKKSFLLPEYKKKFFKMAEKCYPDKLKYMHSIWPICDEAQGGVLMKFGLIQDMKPETIKNALVASNGVLMQYWGKVAEVRSLGSELMKVTMLDLDWNT